MINSLRIPERTIPRSQELVKRCFDILIAIVGIFCTFPIMVVAIIISSIETKSFGIFTQERVGKNGVIFKIIKVKTMRKMKNINTNITTSNDPRITKSGRIFRQLKIDELPQLFNVLVGKMSFVGPRPDTIEMYQDLSDDELLILSVRPGITGPATIKYKNEESLLAASNNPEEFNKEIFKDKVKINLDYINNYHLINDIKYLIQTIRG